MRKDWTKWSKSTFIEWFKSQDDICRKYVSNFEKNFEDENDDSESDEDDDLKSTLQAIANDYTLKKLLKIKNSKDRKHILQVLEKLTTSYVHV